MTTLLGLPDWVPPWAQLLLLIVGILVGLCFLLMPFSVFGVKTRLEALEERLDEIQGEIRSLSLRLPEPGRNTAMEAPYEAPATAPKRPPAARPPIPPAAWRPGDQRPIGTPPGATPATSGPS